MTNSSQPNPVFQMIQQIREQIRKDLYAGKLQYDSSMTLLKRHLKVADEQEQHVLVGQLYETMGTIEVERGNFQDAREYYDNSLKKFEELHDVGRVGVMLNNIGEVYRRSGDVEKAPDYYIQARNIARQTSNHSLIITTYNNEGQTALAAGDLDRAIELLKQGLITHSDSGEWNLRTIKSTLPEIHSSLGEAYARQGDFAQAWKNVERALEISQEFQQVQQIAKAYQTMAFIALQDNTDSHDIPKYIEESSRHWSLLNAKVELARATVLKGDYYKSQDDLAQANKAYKTAIEYLEEAQLLHEAEKIRAKL